MRPREVALFNRLGQGLDACHQREFPLPGVQNPVPRDVFLRQLVDSIRRVKFVGTIATRDIAAARADGHDARFDPVRAALYQSRAGNFDEACWLAFLAVHFGRHRVSGYKYARSFYGALGGNPWTFAAVSADLPGVKQWLDGNEHLIRQGEGRGFGNHRKYMSLSGSKANGTGHAIETYVQWVDGHGGHQSLFATAQQAANNSPEQAFDWLYKSMKSVASYGRIGRFDYLTMIQKLGLATIRPGRPYLDASSKGPNKGARLLLDNGNNLSIADLDRRVQVVGSYLNVGMQEMEDSLCNWGKSPNEYRYFRG